MTEPEPVAGTGNFGAAPPSFGGEGRIGLFDGISLTLAGITFGVVAAVVGVLVASPLWRTLAYAVAALALLIVGIRWPRRPLRAAQKIIPWAEERDRRAGK
jgi:hypothetical protein